MNGKKRWQCWLSRKGLPGPTPQPLSLAEKPSTVALTPAPPKNFFAASPLQAVPGTTQHLTMSCSVRPSFRASLPHQPALPGSSLLCKPASACCSLTALYRRRLRLHGLLLHRKHTSRMVQIQNAIIPPSYHWLLGKKRDPGPALAALSSQASWLLGGLVALFQNASCSVQIAKDEHICTLNEV